MVTGTILSFTALMLLLWGANELVERATEGMRYCHKRGTFIFQENCDGRD
jgi:hypothetical protein